MIKSNQKVIITMISVVHIATKLVQLMILSFNKLWLESSRDKVSGEFSADDNTSVTENKSNR